MAELVMSAVQIEADPGRWLAERRKGITATDAATILGMSPWDSAFALWHRKNGNLPERPDNDRMRLGRELERYVLVRWMESYQWSDDIGDGWVWGGGLFREGWRMATPDYLICDPSDRTARKAVIECKTVGSWDGWGHGLGKQCSHCTPEASCHDECDPDAVPAYVRVQVLWQADVLGVPVAHVAALHRSSGEFRWYTIGAWQGEQAHELQECRKFWESLGNGGYAAEPPPVDGAEATTAALKALHHPEPGTTVYLDTKLVNEWDDARALEAHGKARAAELRNRVLDAMGDASRARYVDEEGQEWQIATRTVGKRAGYWVGPAETDTLRYGRKKIRDDD
jgi:predicted phage-related endonuclease